MAQKLDIKGGEATIGRVYIRYGLTSRLANFIYAMTL
jgi:hypothetical protein